MYLLLSCLLMILPASPKRDTPEKLLCRTWVLEKVDILWTKSERASYSEYDTLHFYPDNTCTFVTVNSGFGFPVKMKWNFEVDHQYLVISFEQDGVVNTSHFMIMRELTRKKMVYHIFLEDRLVEVTFKALPG